MSRRTSSRSSRGTRPSGRGGFLGLVGVLLLAGAALAGPDADQETPPKPQAEAEAGAAQAPDGEEGAKAQDYYFLRDDLIRNKDGTLTWFYLTNHVEATVLGESIAKIAVPGLKVETRKRLKYDFKYRRDDKRTDIDSTPNPRPVADENLLLLTFHPAYKDIVEEFLERFDVPEPQVFIKAKVVEVTLDRNLEYGTSLFFDRGGGDPAKDAASGGVGSSNPNAFFRAFRSQFRPTSFGSSVLSPANTGLTFLFDDLLGDEGTITAAIEALEERGSASILSEPSVVASQGQLATLVTGQETPVSEILVTGGSERISTVFKETGIRLDFTPLHVGREYVKMRVRVEVSSITGFLEQQGPETLVQNPIIAQRNSETVVSVRDGMTLVIGGLYAVSELEDRIGVPILADIPVLRFLFSKKTISKVKSELDFFITPIILRQRLAKSVFVPPMERRRLEGLRKRQGEPEKGRGE